MREIKIRIFDTESNKMLGDLLTFKDGGIVFVGDLLMGKKMENIKKMNFTGIVDINGVDIYEGDIILEHHTGLKYSVDYEDGSYGYSTTRICTGSVEEYEIEVIGNIYENPEVLGAGDLIDE